MTNPSSPEEHPLAGAFDRAVLAQGWRLFRSGSVDCWRDREDNVVAAVQDGSRHMVTMFGQIPDLHARCACWFARSGRRCGHMFAAVLAAEAKSLIDLSSLKEPGLAWRVQLRRIRRSIEESRPDPLAKPRDARLVYVLEPANEFGVADLLIYREKRLKSGQWGKPHRYDSRQHAPPTGEDEAICAMLFGAGNEGGDVVSRYEEFDFGGPLVRILLPRLCATERFYIDDINDPDYVDGLDDGAPVDPPRIGPLKLDEHPWSFRIALRSDDPPAEGQEPLLRLFGEFFSGERVRPTSDAAFVSEEGFAYFRDATVCRVETPDAHSWASFLNENRVLAPSDARDDVVRELIGFERAPHVEAEGVAMETADAPQPRIALRPRMAGRRNLEGRIYFLYGEHEVEADGGTAGYEVGPGRFLMRNRVAEAAAVQLAVEAGASIDSGVDGEALTVSVVAAALPEFVNALLAAGWIVEAEGHRHRRFKDIRMSVNSGIDWFDLDGTITFDDQAVKLSQVLSSMRKSNGVVRLGDGSVGVLPENWLKQLGMLMNIGRSTKDQVRFSKSQAWMLDAMLAARSEVAFDLDFQRFRDRLRDFEGVQPIQEEPSFKGTLRDYQRLGLGWFEFVTEMGLGACLADDMGLGKTVQVLALLDRRRAHGDLEAPALVVAPRSVVPNWLSEAERFTPHLRTLEYTGPNRHRLLDDFTGHDLIVTTYGTLRSDIAHLQDHRFSYAVLDEAQAIKNEQSQTAKAARLLHADRRLALSGTPIENHLGELWSLFEFLNPGMLGRSTAFKRISGAKGLLTDDELRDAMRKALRPFILRRTKDQVASSLPKRVEQSITCEMEDRQREMYNSIRAEYRRSIDEIGAEAGSNKLHVLEALLRLRQAACHPGLIDKSRSADGSGKFHVLLPMLREVVDGGHKALVFSQFTSLLDLLEPHLKTEHIEFTRLDGSTRNRREKVDRFQQDPACSLFLISLKAGGLGLNLTAAEYVFILDPWWNPAAEAQAIDRAHRIGQTRQVVAYRLITQDSVEEKILNLQRKKRELADAILTEDTSVLRDLTAEDLEFLLS